MNEASDTEASDAEAAIKPQGRPLSLELDGQTPMQAANVS